MSHWQPPTPEPSTPALVGAAQSGTGATAHVIALIAGVPVALLMLGWVANTVLWGDPPSVFALLLGGSSACGCVLAVRGMRARPRRHRAVALVLTLVPALVIGLFVVMAALLVVAIGNPN